MQRLALLMIALAACGAAAQSTGKPAAVAAPAAAPVGSLYDRLGGKAAIAVVVDDFVANLLGDDAIKARFANTDAPAFKAKLVDQICEATGGPCKYTGKTMREAHAGMKISDAEFGALVADLEKALGKNKVPESEQSELLAALSGMHGDIVNQ